LSHRDGRSLPIPNQAKVFFENQMAEAKQKKSLFLFCKDDGTRLNDIEDIRGKRNRNGSWYQLVKEANVPLRKLMQTRHTFAVQAIMSGSYTLQEISSMLGHNSLEMLFSHYGKHLGNSHLNVVRSVDIFGGLGDFEKNNEFRKGA
jgi:integrase